MYARTGVPPMQLVLDQLTSDAGNGMLYAPFFNYGYGDLSMTYEATLHPRTRMGLSDAGAHCGAICDGPPAGDGLARRTAWSIDAAARLVPKATCLVRAMAARRLLALKARSSTIRIGVRGGAAGDFEAHAWLVSGDVIVVGGSESELRGFSPIIGAPS